MNINQYIDICIISEYADKQSEVYELNVRSLPKNELSHFFDLLVNKDKDIREYILDHMQDLVDSRIPFVESRDKLADGLIPIIDDQTGEPRWIDRGAA